MNIPHCHGCWERIRRSPSPRRRVTIRSNADRQVGGGLGEHAGRVGDDHTSTLARSDVDVVVADGDVGDDLEIGSGIEERVVDSIGQERDGDVGRGELFVANVDRNLLVVVPGPDFTGLPQDLETGIGDTPRDDDPAHAPATHAASLPMPSEMSSTSIPE